jgi:selenide,water dikinase
LGFETNDDAAVYRLNDDTAAVLTLDFFTPVVDDPYEFGAIAAANALSDIFAMGAKPLAALNILAFPRSLGTAVVKEVLRGGADKVAEASAFLMGGHSIDDDEPKYGLAVFGTASPAGIVRNSGAQIGDKLFYTKRIGTGIMAAALRAALITEAQMRPAIDSMMELNRAASEAMLAARAHAATDVTGFGLAGHLHEMLAASGVAAQLAWEAIPLFEGVYQLSADYCRPGKTFDIIEWARPFIQLSAADAEQADARLGVICDPQTSGGLIVAVAPEQADRFTREFARLSEREPTLIGEITAGPAGMITLASEWTLG